MRLRALFLDFEDSFSFNVVQELTEAGLAVTVIGWNDFSKAHEADLLVLGPGPGHPDEYQSIFALIQDWLASGKKIFGICLGHQILWRLKGKEVQRSAFPIHGQKISLDLSPEWQKFFKLPASTWVQRYNSLAVTGEVSEAGMMNHVKDGEILISRSPQVITYQFHPESVGTNCRPNFFNVIFSNLL